MRALLAAVLAAAPAAAFERVVNDPLPALGRAWAPVLEQVTTASRHETVAELHASLAAGKLAAVEAKWLGANIEVPNFGNETRYLSNEAELEAMLPLDRLPTRQVRLAVTGFASRYWLDARDGAGGRRNLTRSFAGTKLIGEGRGGALRPSLAMKTMRVFNETGADGSVTALGLGMRAGPEAGPWEAVLETGVFLENPFDYERPWGLGLRCSPNDAVTLGLYASNTYGALSPDSFFGTTFTQYRLVWTYRFQEAL